jgi:LysR family carnitine catabolism transcriptional activator
MANITLRQLRAFLAVARARSFTRAASELNLTQSALTMAIRGLEAEVGLRLLDRSTRAVAPTAHGERFMVTAEACSTRCSAPSTICAPSPTGRAGWW